MTPDRRVPARSRKEVFDRLYEDGRAAVLAGTHRQDAPPEDGGRWPVTVVAIPPRPTRETLEGWMTQARAFAGPGHFLTGRTDASHVTIRALEAYREGAHPAEARSEAWASAMTDAARDTAPLRLHLTGVTLAAGSVMAQLEPADDGPWTFMERLREALGDQAWFEDQWGARDIWYVNILHLAAPVADPAGLVRWVDAHREVPADEVVLDSVSLVRYRYQSAAAGRLMAMEPWFTTPFRQADSQPQLT